MVPELPQGTTTTIAHIRDATAVSSFNPLALTYFKQLLILFQKAYTAVEVF